jgi:hypothetical protein
MAGVVFSEQTFQVTCSVNHAENQQRVLLDAIEDQVLGKPETDTRRAPRNSLALKVHGAPERGFFTIRSRA